MIVAVSSATSNGLGAGAIVVNTPPTSGPNTAKKAVEVILNQNLDRMFTSIFTQTKVPEQARAVALITDASKACIEALNPSAKSQVAGLRKSLIAAVKAVPGVGNVSVNVTVTLHDAVMGQGCWQSPHMSMTKT